MAYCTVEDIRNVLPEAEMIQLTDDEDLGHLDEGRVAEAVGHAGAEIDSYCGGRYAVPFSVVPDVVRSLAVDLAVYNLYSRAAARMPEVRRERRASAVRRLEGIARGYVTLGPAIADPAVTGSETSATEDASVFSRSRLGGF